MAHPTPPPQATHPPARRLHADAWPVSRSLTHLTVGNATLVCDALLRKCPALVTVDLDGCTLVSAATTVARSIASLAAACPLVDEVRARSLYCRECARAAPFFVVSARGTCACAARSYSVLCAATAHRARRQLARAM